MSAYAGPLQTELVPDDAAMFGFLTWWFEKCNRGAIELCWRDPPTGRWDLVRRFELDDINGAVLFAAETNARPGCSVYFRPATVHFQSMNTTDSDVVQIPGPWTDCDTAESVEHMLAANPMPSAQVVTGRCPELRAQFYYKATEPILGECSRQLNRQVHVLSGGDGAVTNPSTLMRLPGSIAWPWKAGREIELTEWITPDGGGDVFTPDTLHTSLPPVEDGDAPTRLNGHATGDTASDALLNPVRILLEQAKDGPVWHDPVLRLVGMLVARGTPSCVIEALAPELTWPRYTVEQTRAEIRVMIDGARRKGFAPDESEPTADGDSTVEDDVMDVQPAKTAAIQFMTDSEVEALPDPVWLIEDVLVENSLAVLYGLWGSYKSFVALDWALSLATGTAWLGKAAMKADVLYICAEGIGGLKNRIAAWKQHHGINGSIEGVRIVPQAINLMDRASAEHLIVSAVEVQQASGFTPKLVICDTLARSMAGGDENTMKDMALVIANADLIRRKLGGATFLPVHHSGKDQTLGMRGSSGLPSAADTSLRLTRTDPNVEMLCEKQKDGEAGWTLHMKAEKVILPPREGSLKPRSSLVLIAGQPSEAKATGKQGDAGIGLNVLADLVVAEGVALPTVDGFPTPSTPPLLGVTELAWRREFYRRLTDRTQDARQKAFSRMVKELRDARLIGLCDGVVWLAKRQDQPI